MINTIIVLVMLSTVSNIEILNNAASKDENNLSQWDFQIGITMDEFKENYPNAKRSHDYIPFPFFIIRASNDQLFQTAEFSFEKDDHLTKISYFGNIYGSDSPQYKTMYRTKISRFLEFLLHNFGLPSYEG